MRTQKGFTLIELVMVIVILGILAAVAIPRFLDIEDEAAQARVEGVAGGLSSASAINYAACSAVDHNTNDPRCIEVNSCDDVGALMNPPIDTTTTGTTPASVGTYSVEGSSTTTALATSGETDQCTLHYMHSANEIVQAPFSIISAGIQAPAPAP